jgi:hypothetical protein
MELVRPLLDRRRRLKEAPARSVLDAGQVHNLGRKALFHPHLDKADRAMPLLLPAPALDPNPSNRNSLKSKRLRLRMSSFALSAPLGRRRAPRTFQITKYSSQKSGRINNRS